MAIVEVGSGSQRAMVSAGPLANFPLDYPGDVTADNLLLCGGSRYDQAVTGIIDTRGTDWDFYVMPERIGGGCAFLGWGIAPSSGPNEIEVQTAASGNFVSYGCTEFSGIDIASLIDVAAFYGSFDDPKVANPSIDIETDSDEALIVGIGIPSGQPGFISPGAGYTQIVEEENWNAWMAFNLQFRIGGAAGVHAVPWILDSDAHYWAMSAMAFKAAAGAPDVPMKRRGMPFGI